MPGNAQEIVEIRDGVACPTCVIEEGPRVTLAPPTYRVWFKSVPFPDLARDSEGNYIVAPVGGGAVLAVFGADGGYTSSFGRIGEGPGEFRAHTDPALGVGKGDVLYAIDLLHFHTLAPRAESSLGRVRMPVFRGDVVVLRDGIAVQAPVRTEAGMTTIQILRPDGTIGASIAPAETNDEPSQRDMLERTDLRRRLGRANDHVDLWSAPLNRYRLERLGPGGETKIRIERVTEWFQPYSESTPGAGFTAPADPTVTGIHQDAKGLLWIIVGRPPPTFTPVVDAPIGVEVPLDPYMDRNQILHTTVEVIDPVAGELVARREFEEYVKFVVTPGDDVFIFSLHPDALGNLDCVVRPLKLRRE